MATQPYRVECYPIDAGRYPSVVLSEDMRVDYTCLISCKSSVTLTLKWNDYEME